MTTVLNFKGELGRKGLHLLALVLPAAMLVLTPIWAYAFLFGLTAVAIGFEVGRSRPGPVRDLIDGAFGWMMRPEERRPGSGFCGATWVVSTAALLYLAFEPGIAAAGMSMTLVGDAAAALVGRTWGRRTWPGSKRTVEGTIAFMATATVTSLAFPGLSLPARVAAAIASAAAELLPIPLNDNLVLPFTAAGVLALLAA